MLSPGDKLFSNYISAVREFEDLRRHAEYVERLMEQDEQARQIENQHLSAKQAEIEDLFANPFPQVFYASVIIANCILLEQHIKGIARTAQAALTRTLSMEGLRGSLIQRFRQYCADVLGVDLGFSTSEWDFLSGLFLLRNCFVHAGGQMGSGQLRDFVAAQELLVFEDSVSIYLEHVLKLLSRTWDLVDAMYAAAMRKFPSKQRMPT